LWRWFSGIELADAQALARGVDGVGRRLRDLEEPAPAVAAVAWIEGRLGRRDAHQHLGSTSNAAAASWTVGSYTRERSSTRSTRARSERRYAA
jgi:hypothetical protein